jgi:hypothetical protein
MKNYQGAFPQAVSDVLGGYQRNVRFAEHRSCHPCAWGKFKAGADMPRINWTTLESA